MITVTTLANQWSETGEPTSLTQCDDLCFPSPVENNTKSNAFIFSVDDGKQ